jgi:hypothetical protein
MQTFVVLSALVLFDGSAARAQDPGMDAAMQANQMAMQAAQQANQQALQDMQLANQLATQQTMDSMQPSNWWAQWPSHRPPYVKVAGTFRTAPPQLSKGSGLYSGTVTVRLKDHTKGATIYYTTDGWTPTRMSAKYTGPIAIDATTTLGAVAIAPNFARSIVSWSTYIFRTPAPATPASISLRAGTDGSRVVASDTTIPLEFAQPLSSDTAKVGDPVRLTVAEDVRAGDTVAIPKGTPAVGSVVRVVPVRPGENPGHVAFKVDSLTVRGQTLPLHRVAALDGAFDPAAQDARITVGTPVTATMPAGTVLPGSVTAN